MIESERERTSATRQVEDLNRQRESITSYLDELRNLLGHNPDRATLERATRAEAAFEKEQKSAPSAKAGNAPADEPSAPKASNQGSNQASEDSPAAPAGKPARPASRPTKSRPAPVSAAIPVVQEPSPEAGPTDDAGQEPSDVKDAPAGADAQDEQPAKDDAAASSH